MLASLDGMWISQRGLHFESPHAGSGGPEGVESLDCGLRPARACIGRATAYRPTIPATARRLTGLTAREWSARFDVPEDDLVG